MRWVVIKTWGHPLPGWHDSQAFLLPTILKKIITNLHKKSKNITDCNEMTLHAPAPYHSVVSCSKLQDLTEFTNRPRAHRPLVCLHCTASNSFYIINFPPKNNHEQIPKLENY